MASTGETRQKIRDEWDLPLLKAWYGYCADHPPVHILVAAYMGIKPKSKPDPDRLEGEEAIAFLMSNPALAHR
jgi:hypothetical protein